MKTRPFLTFLLCILFSDLASFAQSTVPPIGGWNMDEKGGSYIFKPEKTPGDNKEFIYEVMPFVKGEGQSIEDWFNTAIDKDLQQSGFVLPASAGKKNIITNHFILSFSAEITDKKGKSWFVNYISYQTANNEYRLARVLSSPDIKYYATNMRPAANHFSILAKQIAGESKSGNTTHFAKKHEESVATFDENTTSEKGLKSTDINGVLIHLEYNYAPDGKMLRVYKPYLVLNDGTIYSDPVVSPYSFDVSQSKQKEPKKWGTWKLKGNSFNVEWTGRNESEKWFKNWFWATPAMKDERIEGLYMTVDGNESDNAKAAGFKNIAFNNTGQFALTNLSNNGNANVPTSEFSKRNEAGTYIVNDYSIELRFNNGQVIRRTFYFYLQGKTHFGIGNNVYVPKHNGESTGTE
jgi:hypothetical protein